jgi:hypothetical protein
MAYLVQSHLLRIERSSSGKKKFENSAKKNCCKQKKVKWKA